MAIFLPVMEFSIPPWTLGDEIMKIFHSLWKLRLKLQPELVRLAHIAVKFGMPIIRPIWWLDQVDDALLEETEFLVGRDILVAPVWNPYDTFREVYLPEGEWISQQDRRTYEGPAKIMQDVPRDKIAFFLRSGANFSIPFEIPPTDSSERTIDEL